MIQRITTVVVLMIAFATISCCSYPNKCPISLPQFVQRGSECYKSRQQSLARRRFIYGIKEASDQVPFSKLDMSIPEYVAFLKKEPFLSWHAQIWKSQAEVAKKVASVYLKMTKELPTIMKLPEYAQAIQFFKTSMETALDGFVKYPSSVEPFQADMTTWISDQFFAEQRLAGVNPMTIQRVTFSNKIGMHWKKLKKMLNPEFDLVNAVAELLNSVDDEKSFKKAIRQGYLYVLHHPLSNDIHDGPDIAEKDPNRKLRDFMSPISIFASVSKYSHSVGKVTRFMPVAIQLDSKSDSPVFTPDDGDKWMLAKLTAQQTDIGCSQIVEHLSKVHFVSEIICLSIERQLSKLHPLYAIMKYHCRGIFSTNTLGAPGILNENQILHYVLAYGTEGSNYLVKEAAKIVNWKDLDMVTNIKRRGMNHKRVPYYPYRNDGKVILRSIRNMVNDYVNTYYNLECEVKDDQELQNFANEVSDEGIGPNGGKGHMRGFPTKISSKKELTETLTQIIWLMSAQHSAINYPLPDYGAYMPNEPVKLYDDKRVPNDKFSGARLPNRHITAASLTFQMTIGTLRYDRLFDYGVHLDDPKARQVLYRHFSRLTREVEPFLQNRNKKRLKHGRLTYPYLLPRWLTNSIQS